MNKNEEEILRLLKRIETKLSHGFNVQGINITDKQLKDNILNKLFIERNESNNNYVIRVLHEDVTINDLKKFLENKVGEFLIISGDTQWKIIK